jgi:uncharacterized membrane protein YcaP (DUF421 family)
VSEIVAKVFGSSSETIAWWQMVLRACLSFAFLLLLLRLGRRTFGQMSPLDIAVTILLGSTLSRTVTANSPLGPTFAACAAFMVLHGVLGKLTILSARLGTFVKGREIQLVREGRLLREEMHRASVTEHDLLESLRSSTGTSDLGKIEAAYLERSGHISFIRR